MAKYIFRSEKRGNTCSRCKSYDGKIFYEIKDIPNLPLHPNCRCWIETIESENDLEKKCDCADRIKIIKNNLSNLYNNFNNLEKSMENDFYELNYGKENIQTLLENLTLLNDDLKGRLGKHRPLCPQYADVHFQKVSSHLNYIKEYKKEVLNLINMLHAKKQEMSENKKLIKEDIYIDVLSIEEFYIDNIHIKKECKAQNSLKNIENNIVILNKKLDDGIKDFNDTRQKILTIQDGINKIKKAHYDILKNDSKKCICIKQKDFEPQLDAVETIIDIGIRSMSLRLTVATNNYKNAMDNFKHANNKAHILKSSNELFDKNLQQLLNKVGVPKNSRGVLYDTNSDESKKLFKSIAIQKYIKNNKSKLINGKENKILDFRFDYDIFGLDEYMGIQHCKLYNPKITTDGYFEAAIVDYYDFAYRNKDENAYIQAANIINNAGYTMQEKGLLENYFNIYYIRGKIK